MALGMLARSKFKCRQVSNNKAWQILTNCLTMKAKVEILNQTSGKKTEKRNTVMAKPSNTQKNLHWLHRLAQVAGEARARVSSYSDDRRSKLEEFSRSVTQGAKAAQVCRR